VAPAWSRWCALVVAGYLIFTVASVPAMLFAGPHELGCDDCPTNVLLIHRDRDLATIALGFQALLYVALFVVVLVRLTRRWRRAVPLDTERRRVERDLHDGAQARPVALAMQLGHTRRRVEADPADPVDVTDDGAGALDGTLAVGSPVGGTRLHVEVPCAGPAATPL
jgi:hypothetical protein